MTKFDVIVIGGGPAGLAAAVSAKNEGASVAIVERENRLGGILKQCVHDGFGLIRFGQKLAGPEYAQRYIDMLGETDATVMLQTFVTKIEKETDGFSLWLVSRDGVSRVEAKAIVLATGCRERTARQVLIQGTRPSGIFTAGTAQNFVNLQGKMPTKKCVILGSGDIGLIMARRLTLEGATVEGVYEIKDTPSGLTRNIHQCLNDFNIPLHLSHSVTKVFGKDRVEAVEVAEVDAKMQPIPGTERRVECDALILSVGLLPENEIAESLSVKINPFTKGPVTDQNYMSVVDGVFSAGNALNVFDLVDYVSECAEKAGRCAAKYVSHDRVLIGVDKGNGLLSLVPSKLDVKDDMSAVTVYFRAAKDMDRATLKITVDSKEVLTKKYTYLRPPEMQRLDIDFASLGVCENSRLEIALEEK